MIEPLSPEAEHALLQNATDPQAFSQIYRHYFPRIYAYVAYRITYKQDAEDVTSGIFLQVVKSIHRFDYRGTGSFTAWIFRIAQNAVKQHFRERKPSVTLHDNHVDTSTPDAIYLEQERLKRLRDILRTLSPRRQEIISLRYFSGLRNSEIAEMLGLDERTVASHLVRGLADLQNKYVEKDFLI